jgi:hypothetical protein
MGHFVYDIINQGGGLTHNKMELSRWLINKMSGEMYINFPSI